LARYLAQVLYRPLVTFFRHLIVTPLSLLYPPLRQWVWEHWSSFVIDLSYKRKLQPTDPVTLWTTMEIACHLRAVLLVTLIVSGINPWYNALIKTTGPRSKNNVLADAIFGQNVVHR